MNTTPHRLRVEHLDLPLGITIARPRLSWQLPRLAQTQLAYQVQAGDWDSGRVDSPDNVLVEVAAPPLHSRERRSWRVRVWTDQGRSDWSTEAVVEAGLLNSSDWTASWIRPAEAVVPPAGQRPAHLLRRVFTLDQPIAAARGYATAQGVYELFVNGARVGDAELTPGFTDYRTALQVQTYDLGESLSQGTNVVAAVLSDGWFRGINGMFRDADCFGDRTALLLQLHLTLADGTELVLGTDPQWCSRVGAITSADLMEGITADLRRDPSGWAESHFDDSSWDPVAVVQPPEAALISSAAPPVRRTETRHPLSITRAPSGDQVVDFGENIVGWTRLTELGPAGTHTVLTYAEALSPEGEASQRNLLPDHLPPGGLEVSAGQIDRVTSAGRPGEIFEPRHATKGFRYVGVHGAARDLTARDIAAMLVNTDFRRTGSFRCSDERLNQFHEVAERSFLGNAVDIPTDCPTRERSGWTGDWAVFAQPAAFLFDVAGFSDKWLRDLAAQQFDDGVVPNWVPDHFGPSIRQHPLLGSNLGSAGWGDAAVLVPWEMYLAYGDRCLLQRQWPSMVAWVDRAATMARTARHPGRVAARPVPEPYEEFLWDTGFHFGEWLEPGVQLSWEELQQADFAAVATAYLRLSSGLLSQIATILGEHEAAEHYRAVSDGARRAWQAEFVTADVSVTIPDTQATLVRALAFDLVDAGLRVPLAERLVAQIHAAGDHLGTGFLATPHLLPVLADAGHLDLAYTLLRQSTPPSWLHMLDQGATTVWELWDAIDDTGVAHESLNHYSKGAVIGFLHRHVAGLRMTSDGPGYRRFVVQPQPGPGLTWAEANHDSPYGRIEVSWRVHGSLVRLRVTVPPGAVADVVLPDGRRTETGPGTSVFEFPAHPGAHVVTRSIKDVQS